MSLRNERNKTREAILQGKFVTDVLRRTSVDIDVDIDKRTSGFSSEFWSNRDFSVDENTMRYTHLKQHRFVNMKTRTSRAGVERKVSHPIHNQPLYGFANEIIKELVVGFSDGVREQMAKLTDDAI